VEQLLVVNGGDLPPVPVQVPQVRLQEELILEQLASGGALDDFEAAWLEIWKRQLIEKAAPG
jgi:hypothetical protein